jgi:hypothetical protein
MKRMVATNLLQQSVPRRIKEREVKRKSAKSCRLTLSSPLPLQRKEHEEGDTNEPAVKKIYYSVEERKEEEPLVKRMCYSIEEGKEEAEKKRPNLPPQQQKDPHSIVLEPGLCSFFSKDKICKEISFTK